MARADVTSGFLTAALVVCGLVVAALLYGFATRSFTPRTAPTRADVQTAADSAEGARAERLLHNRIQVEVLNGAGVRGLAAEAQTLLRRRGFDVIGTGNASPADTTVVAATNGTRDEAARVAAALGLPDRRVVDAESADENAATVRVTLGRDYSQFNLSTDSDPIE